MNKAYFTNEYLDNRKTALLARKAEIEEQLSSFAKRDPHEKSNFSSEFPVFGDKEEDNATEVAAFENNLSLEETLEQSLEMINRALANLKTGTYGLCVKCGQPIAQDRLEIMPTATRCTNNSCAKNGNNL